MQELSHFQSAEAEEQAQDRGQERDEDRKKRDKKKAANKPKMTEDPVWLDSEL